MPLLLYLVRPAWADSLTFKSEFPSNFSNLGSQHILDAANRIIQVFLANDERWREANDIVVGFFAQ